MNAEHYTYRVRWSQSDLRYVGTVAEMPSLSWLDEQQDAAFAGIRRLADEVVADMEESGETPPTPIAERSFSGRFLVRVGEDLHRQLVLEAAEQRMSLNALASTRLAASSH